MEAMHGGGHMTAAATQRKDATVKELKEELIILSSNRRRRQKMKVILKQDVKKVGKRGDIVDVSDGYGRNFLIARGLAVAESKASLEILKEQKSEEAAHRSTA